MSLFSENFIQKSLAIVLMAIFLAVLILTGLSFIKPESSERVLNKEINYPIDKVWTSVFERKHYLSSKNGILKYNIYEDPSQGWTEYYSSTDSVENKLVAFRKNRLYHYVIINRKYEQVSGIKIHIDSLAPNQTRLMITEKTICLNNWGNIYFRVMNPDLIVNFEVIKIMNTLKYMDSIKPLSSQ